MKILLISSSPRRDGNSQLLAESAYEGAVAAGHHAEFLFLDDYVERMLGNCRLCRRPEDRMCSLDDRYSEFLLDHVLPADGVIFAMPLHFYGMPARLKAVFDRLFCYTSNSSPVRGRVVDGIMDTKIGVLISCEERYPGATAAVIAQFQELARYLNQELVDVVVGHANTRGEIVRDPTDPMRAARRLGSEMFTMRATDYRLDTVRPNRVWGGEPEIPEAISETTVPSTGRGDTTELPPSGRN